MFDFYGFVRFYCFFLPDPSLYVNRDGDVDEIDVFLIIATIMGESLYVNGDGNVDADDRTAADANIDGNVDTNDILLVFEKRD